MTDLLGRLRGLIVEALEAGDSQEALAERLGVTQATISRWKGQDGPEPKAGALEAVVRDFDVSGHWLLTGQGDRRAMPEAGPDALVERGIQLGLQRAEKAIHDLRATSTLSEAERRGLEVIATRDKLVAGQANPPRRVGGGAHRKTGGH